MSRQAKGSSEESSCHEPAIPQPLHPSTKRGLGRAHFVEMRKPRLLRLCLLLVALGAGLLTARQLVSPKITNKVDEGTVKQIVLQPEFPAKEEEANTDTRPRVTIVMCSTPNILPYAQLAADINEAYAKKHGYNFVHEIEDFSEKNDAIWKKVEIIRKHLGSSDAVMFVDSDAAFNNHSQNLEFLFDVAGDIIGSSDHPNGHFFINTGLVFVKNTPIGHSLMDAWWRIKASQDKYQELPTQTALDELVERTPLGAITALPAETFNSIYHNVMQGKRDTFVLHFMASDATFRMKELQAMKNRLMHE